MRRLLLLLTLPLTFLLSSCGVRKTNRVATSIFPLTWLVKKLFPTYEVYQIIKPGTNPHAYDLTPKDAVEIESSRKVFLIGNLEPFAGKIPPKKRVEVIEILNLPPSVNPHLWLSPKRWLQLARRLPDSVKDLKFNIKSWNNTVFELERLDQKYEKVLGQLKPKVVLILPAFYWTFEDYGGKVLYILQPNPQGGLSPRRFTQAVEELKNNPDAVVVYSTTNPRAGEIIEKLKENVPHLKTVGLNPLIWETQGDYISLMEENLQKIKAAFGGKTE